MTDVPSPKFKRAVLLTAIAVSAMLFVRVLFRVALPTGSLTVKTDFIAPAPYVSDLKPNGRFGESLVGDDGVVRTLVGATPVYVDLRPPFAFTGAEVTLAYENPDHAPVELAALASASENVFERRVIEHPLLDGISWKRITDGRIALYQRTPRYSSIEAFRASPPARATVATMGVDESFLPPYRIDGYVPSPERREIEVSLRGRHELLVYVGAEPLDLAFVTQDMNRTSGGDAVEVIVRSAESGKIVARAALPDDGNTSADQRSTPLRTLPLTVLDPGEGVYRVEFSSGDDVFIRKIVTKQRKIVFEDALYLGDHIGYSDRNPSVIVQVRGSRIDALTHRPESLQELSLSGARLKIAQTHTRVGRSLPAGTVEIISPKRDVVLETDGVFALTPDDMFDPLPFRIGARASAGDLDARGIGYVIAAYEPSALEEGATVATVSFDLSALDRTEEGAYRIAVALPALADTNHSFHLRSLRVTFTRPHAGMFASIREFFFGANGVRDPDAVIGDPVSFREYVP